MDNYCSKKYIVRCTKTDTTGNIITGFDYEDDDIQKCIDYINTQKQNKSSNAIYELIENTPYIY